MLRLVLIACLWVSACTGEETPIESDIIGPTWKLERIDGEVFAATATLVFDPDGSVRGRAPCNSYGGSLAAPLPAFNVPAMRVTRAACPELAAERRYFEALGVMDRAGLEDGRLVLSGPSGRSMEFRAGLQD